MRALFAWELGRNLGHVTQIVDVAKVLQSKGWEVFFALKSPQAIDSFGEGLEYRLIQAPFSPVKRIGTPAKPFKPLFYPDELVPCGYDDPGTLAALIRCWRDLFDLVQPDVLVEQAAPTALLAAKGLPLARVSLGRSYDIPFVQTPMPAFRYWEKTDHMLLAQREQWILGNINAALEKAGTHPALQRFAQLLEVDREYLCTIRELDHYPERAELLSEAGYLGPFAKTDSGEHWDWSEQSRYRVLAYLQPHSPMFGKVATALHKLPNDHDIIVVAPSISAAAKKSLSKPNLRVSEKPLRLDNLLPTCDLCINHASAGICSASVLQGVPMLLFPTHIEQEMFARAVCRAGLGERLGRELKGGQIVETLRRLLSNPAYRENSRRLASKYGGFCVSSLASFIATDIQELVAEARVQPAPR